MKTFSLLQVTLYFFWFFFCAFSSVQAINLPTGSNIPIPSDRPQNLGESNNSPSALSDESQDITSPEFTIDTGSFTPGGTTLGGGTAKGTVKNVLSTIIDKLIIAFGVLSLFIMTLGAGYIIIHHGEDGLLTQGKSIFVAGLTSLAIALSAGLIVKLISYLLYQ